VKSYGVSTPCPHALVQSAEPMLRRVARRLAARDWRLDADDLLQRAREVAYKLAEAFEPELERDLRRLRFSASVWRHERHVPESTRR
jgi:Sigma-70 region 2